MNEEMSWIIQAQNGSDEAFTRLVEQYQTPVFNMCYRMLGEAEAAEDAAQESFLRAYQNLTRYDRQRSFATWLLAIAAHYCIDRLRKRRFVVFSIDEEKEEDDAPIELPDPNALNPELQSIHREEQQQIQIALKKLDAIDRAAIILRYWYDFSEIEIGENLNLTVSAVKSRLHRARKTIARVLNGNSPAKLVERKFYESPAL